MIVLGLSDVTLGFGSSQIPAFMKYISMHYQAEQTIVIEPDQTDIPRRGNEFHGFTIRRITSLSHIYSKGGRIEYILKASKLIDRIKPDVLVIFTTFCVPALIKISAKPKFIIYYSLESVSAYGQIDIEMNRRIASKVDLILFPEENRAARFLEECGPTSTPLSIIYNCTNSQETNSILSADKRNGRILHQGRLKKDTGLDYLLRPEIQNCPIDLYGVIDTSDKDNALESLLTLFGNVKYKGSLNHKEMASIRRFYTYNLVFWQPTSENTLYACPNKFFESIADGIPPIASPHPQCKLLIKRYNCGIALDDWNFESYLSAVRNALNLRDTQEYELMIENCKKAVRQELNWEKQMSKIIKYLKQI